MIQYAKGWLFCGLLAAHVSQHFTCESRRLCLKSSGRDLRNSRDVDLQACVAHNLVCQSSSDWCDAFVSVATACFSAC